MGKKPVYSIVIALSIISTMVVTLFLGGIATTIAQNNGPQVSVSTNSAVANQRITLSATGFTADAEIGQVAAGETQVSGITIESEAIPWARINDGNTVSVNSEGKWTATLDLPLNAVTTAWGSKTIQATDSDGVSDTVLINIPRRGIEIDPYSSRVGTEALTIGEGLPAKNDNGSSFTMTVTYDTGSGNGTTETVVPDANDQLEAYFRIPTTASIPSINTVKLSFQDDDGVVYEETAAHRVLPPRIDFFPKSGRPGTTFHVVGEGFKAYVPVQSATLGSLDMTPVPELTTDAHGMLSFGFRVPNVEPATHTVEVVVGSLTFSSSFTVIVRPTSTPLPSPTPSPWPTPFIPTPTPTPTPGPTVAYVPQFDRYWLSAYSSHPGSVVTVTGENYQPGTPVQSVAVGNIGVPPSPQPIADSNGRFSFDVAIPNLTPGDYMFNLTIRGVLSGYAFKITAAPTPTPFHTPTPTVAPTPAPQLPGSGDPPHVFLGTAWLDGASVPEGTAINAYDGTRLVGATLAGPGGRFSIHTLRSDRAITFTVNNHAARETWASWEIGKITPNFHLNASTVARIEDSPALVFQANPELVSVFTYDNTRKRWQFFDPVVGDASTIESFTDGQVYQFRVSRTANLQLNGAVRTLSCSGDNCWNQIVW